MKVFISWSGELSHKIALILRDWLPSVIQAVEPYVSSEDIDKGARWSGDISKELEESSFGIICVTRENVRAPWINFEAGALSRSFDRSRVCPLLFGIKKSELQGPLLQFQFTTISRDDIRKLLHSLNSSYQPALIEEGRLACAFEVWWPGLEESLSELGTEPGEDVDESSVSESGARDAASDVLEEVLDLVRSQHKLLLSPESLLPQSHIVAALAPPLNLRSSLVDSVKDDLDSILNRIRFARGTIQRLKGQLKKEDVSDADMAQVLGRALRSLGKSINSLAEFRAQALRALSTWFRLDDSAMRGLLHRGDSQ